MTRLCFFFCALASLAGPVLAQRGTGPDDDPSVEKRLADTTRYLSSDECEGRGLTTHGIELAAQYIAGQFRQLGLRTDFCQGTPFQRFTVVTAAELGRENGLTLIGPVAAGAGPAAPAELTLGRDFTPLAAGDAGRFDVPLVFAGYGITDKEAGVDDYAGLDVTGKAVLVLRALPRPAPPGASGKVPHACAIPHGKLRHKISNAYEHGAAALILCSNLGDAQHPAPPGDPLPELTLSGARCSHPGLPVLYCRRAVVEPAIRATYGTDLATLEAKLDRGPWSRELRGWRLAGRSDIRRVETEVKNVVAVLPGSGRIAQETLVIGAHYDHFGFIDVDVQGKKQRAYYSGADDNASGVATIIEIARYLAHHRHPLERQVVFVSFSAEEGGLLGSTYYVGHPVIPLSRTAMMLNFDMVGRLRDKLFIRGSFTATGSRGLLENLNARHRLPLDLPPDRFGSSDQLSFYAKNVPILQFFTGRHVDYHEVTDKFAKVNVPGMRRIVRFAEDVAEAFADAPARPHYLAAVPPEEREPYFGAYADFTRSDLGYALGPVAKGGPADQAGLVGGDVVVQFGSDRIANVDDFNEALTHHLDGERVHIVVKRGNKSRTCEVKLGLPRRDITVPAKN